ncbi:MAG: hypothetical protein BMS9Abin07_2182 [Acidimicrobiia bacterium]|nr:MAG: hypothetical protein BMS9Abin07_2182 [Acidimicrobiia bacterium]
MLKLLPAIAAFAVVAAGCGTGQSSEPLSTTVAPPSSIAAPSTEAAPAADASGTTTPTTEAQVATEPVIVDGPPAPDFTLALDGGGSFTLSAEEKPVYMVFWAEW